MSIEDDVAFYRDNGYVLCRGVFAEPDVEEIRAAIGRILDTVSGTQNDENHAAPVESPDDIPSLIDALEPGVDAATGLALLEPFV